jgi:hypothetical protein
LDVVTLSAFSIAARSFGGLSNLTLIGMPTPTVALSIGFTVARTVFAGVSVLKVPFSSAVLLSEPVAFAA